MDSRMLLPSSAADVLAQLPNVETLEWDVYSTGDWGRYFVLEQMYRNVWITASQIAPLPGKNIRLRLISPAVREADRLPDLINSLPYDPVACAVRRLTKDCSVSFIFSRLHLHRPRPDSTSCRK